MFISNFKRILTYVQLRVKEDSIKPEALITGQTEGLKVGCGGMGGWPVCEVWVDRWVEGEDKGGV